MLLKTGTKISGIRPELVLALIVAERVYVSRGYELMVTSIIDGTHSVGSLHYVGAAVDLRMYDIVQSQVVGIIEELKQKLGGDFDVVLETDHIHIEFQPKTPINK